MSITDLFWLFFIVVSLQPMLRQKILEAARMRAIRRLEQKRGSRVIALIHRQETLALLGFPLARYIDINDSEEVLRAIKLTDPDVPIDLVLHTPGGLVLAAEQIAYALCCREAPVTVFVPHYAMSGGTLITLAAGQIVMDENAVLGPVDPQLGQYPAVSILKAVARKDVNKVDDETLILADVAEKAIRQVKQTVVQILGGADGTGAGGGAGGEAGHRHLDPRLSHHGAGGAGTRVASEHGSAQRGVRPDGALSPGRPAASLGAVHPRPIPSGGAAATFPKMTADSVRVNAPSGARG